MKLKMNMSTTTSMHTTKRQKSCFRHLLPTIFFLSAVFFIGSAFVVRDYKQRISRWGALNSVQNTVSKMCETHCRPHGIETLPKGIISMTSDLEMRSLSGPDNKKKSKKSMNLLAIAAGIKQKDSVNKIVKKFPPSDFAVMLFHYDGIVEEWNDFEWSAHAIHVSVMNQTKWFVEMMAPVFSRASWRCAWHMIQNDLVHAWGLDFQLGYCAQGDPTKNIGIVDSEYIVHYGLPTLGGVAANKTDVVTPEQTAQNTKLSSSEQQVPLSSHQPTGRDEVRKQSYTELEIFKNRWKKAVKDDDSWIDIVQQSKNQMKP